jgi:hypothetical protein
VFSTDERKERWTRRFARASACEWYDPFFFAWSSDAHAVLSPFDYGVHTNSTPRRTRSPVSALSRLMHRPCDAPEHSPASVDIIKLAAWLVPAACADAIPTCTSM